MNRPGSALTVAVVLLMPLAATRAQTPDAAWYVGREVCAECHGHSARACRRDSIPGHAHAYDALLTPEAAHIATLCGVAEPPIHSRICLGCHTTGSDAGPRWVRPTLRPADGVQCETCHGAGSLHIEASRRGTLQPRAGGAGWLQKPDEAVCVGCHRAQPSHDAVLREGYRVPATDFLYKTPVNLAIGPDGRELFVACEHADSLIVVDLASRLVSAEIKVGRRPQDVAVSPDGARLYVTNRMSGTLSVIDTAARRVVREVTVGAEPHGVMASAAGESVVVLNTGEDSISILDAETLEVRVRLAAGAAPWSLAQRPDDGSFYVTSARPREVRFRDPHYSEVTILDARRGRVSARPVAADANMLAGVAVVPGSDVALFTLSRTKSLVPITRLAQGWTVTNGLGVVWPDGRIDQLLLDEPGSFFPDANDVAVEPRGRHALVTSGGSDQVAVIDVEALLSILRQADERQRREVLPNHLGTSRRFVVRRVPVGRNPRGVVFSPAGDFAYVACALSDSVEVIETAGFDVVAQIDLGGPRDITEIRQGEILFHSAANAYGRQFSCRSCHPDGHINGLTFDIEADGIGMHPVDNRTLRGIIDTGPFKWEGTNPSLHRQCGPRLAVFFTRLDPFTPEELDALVRYECTIQRTPNRHRQADGLTPAQRRGKAIFERTTTTDGLLLLPEQRCITCHDSPYGTSRTRTDVGTTLWFDAEVDIPVADLFAVEDFGELGIFLFSDTGVPGKAFDVPHLYNVHMSPPYLHNGAARTLEEIWTRFNMLDRHGYTRDLTRGQFNDLMAYLRAF